MYTYLYSFMEHIKSLVHTSVSGLGGGLSEHAQDDAGPAGNPGWFPPPEATLTNYPSSWQTAIAIKLIQ